LRFGEVARTLAFVSSLLVFPIVSRWRRREMCAGRGSLLFFEKGKHYPPASSHVPFDKAISELAQKLKRRPGGAGTNKLAP
jgi:hypothetical protein